MSAIIVCISNRCARLQPKLTQHRTPRLIYACPFCNSIPNPERGNTELNTAGRGGDTVRQQLQSHEIDLPNHAPHNAVMPNESSKQPGKSSDTGKPK